MLCVKDLSVSYGNFAVLDQVSFFVERGQWLMIVGPNGAGKSTLVNAISRGAAYTGKVLFDGDDIARLKPAFLAKNMGVLSQSHFVGYSFTVAEVVRMGRYAYSPGLFSKHCDGDEELVQEAINKTGLAEYTDQSVLTLSGGELQRTFLAQLFAQNPKLLILDEPTNHLDIVYQKQIFDLIKDWIDRTNGAVISVVHDLSLARAYGDRALLLHRGREVAFGSVRDTLSRERLAKVYSTDVYSFMRDMLSQWEE